MLSSYRKNKPHLLPLEPQEELTAASAEEDALSRMDRDDIAMDCSLPGSSIHGIFQVRVLEWGAIAFSK